MKISIAGIKTLLLNFPLAVRLLWNKAVRPVKRFWMNTLIESKKIEAKWKHKNKGGTYYVVVVNWHDIRCLDKGHYEYVKKFVKKRYGKDIKRRLVYRADGTLVRNPDYVDNL